jgi:hypothetical protein
MNHCVRHHEETMEATCRSCGAPFCGRCLVFAFGPKKPPFCIGCALNAGGVRNSYRPAAVATPAPTGRHAVRAAKAEAKAAAKAERASKRGRGGRGGDGEPIPLPPAAASPIPFEDDWTEEEDRDVRVPATAQLARLMRSRPSETAGQVI